MPKPFLLLLLVLLCSCSVRDPNYRLLQVLDGDTIIVESLIDSCKDRVRFLGIDAPESNQQEWGRKSTEFVTMRISPGDELFLETLNPPRDKYGRLLAYIFYDSNGKRHFLNEELLFNGLAEVFILNKWANYNTRLKTAEAYARENKLNIWSNNGLTMSPYEFRKKKPAR
jgi:micrococcal nuclease